MRIGDRVSWPAIPCCDEGSEGRIVAIVPARTRPCRRTPIAEGGRYVLAPEFRSLPYIETRLVGRLARPQDSFLIAVGRHLYWPPVSELMPME